MQSICILFMMTFVAVISAQGFFPTKLCPPGEHSVLYCPQAAEPDCDNPTVHELPVTVARVCDIPQCFCNRPTVRDLKTGKCVDMSNCS